MAVKEREQTVFFSKKFAEKRQNVRNNLKGGGGGGAEEDRIKDGGIY